MSSADSIAAERYARAIFELGVESGDEAGLVAKIQAFAAMYGGTRELRNVFENPRVQASEREAILKEVAGRLGFDRLALTVVRYIARRRRLRSLPELAQKLGRLADERRGVVRATVTVAAPLPEAFYENLTRVLETLTGRHIALERLEDPSLIAGVVTRIGDYTADGSLRGRLEHLGQELERS